jgi:hypothetical protein
MTLRAQHDAHSVSGQPLLMVRRSLTHVSMPPGGKTTTLLPCQAPEERLLPGYLTTLSSEAYVLAIKAQLVSCKYSQPTNTQCPQQLDNNSPTGTAILHIGSVSKLVLTGPNRGLMTSISCIHVNTTGDNTRNAHTLLMQHTTYAASPDHVCYLTVTSSKPSWQSLIPSAEYAC